MAQRGETVKTSAEETRSFQGLQNKPSSPARHQETESNDAQKWEIVETPATGKEHDTGEGTNFGRMAVSSHFDFNIGWGKYKFTLFSWDVNVRSETTETEPERKRGSEGGPAADERS
ncbi:hypothetical protein QBC34DRAFT_498606 [Podospora aff. communis PSN243]|uniref:Uncharacterized protein n=1 Tax=Podospora aff. communis PSN243 TaxID=3040156 RepID=A0AAV9G5D2_9PEZI|nr:hypothetical protein QBC34DRAFT_498606 [Podospora aff. communis PSN243]